MVSDSYEKFGFQLSEVSSEDTIWKLELTNYEIKLDLQGLKVTRKEVFNGVQDIFRDIFNEDDMVIEDKTNSDDVEKWDSLNHINLFSAIEKEFKIKFALGELMALKNVGAMIDLVIEKLKQPMNQYQFSDVQIGLK